MAKFICLFFAGFAVFANIGCRTNKFSESDSAGAIPPKMLWAWERPEDLRFLDAKKFGVAFLAETLILKNDEVVFNPRRQPLKVSPNTFLIAVTRIETDKVSRPSLSNAQRREIVSHVKKTLNAPGVRGVQIDFDALVSERDFYKVLLSDLKTELPAATALSMTALASWCASDDWLADLPVDEAVPMAFEMGADDKNIRQFLGGGADWNEPLCRNSYGIDLNEPLKADFKPNRRFYIFNQRGWKAEDLSRLPEGVNP